MKELQVPEFSTYEEEADFWDNLDTADFMEDDDQWFRFETPNKRAIRVAILPEIAKSTSTRCINRNFSECSFDRSRPGINTPELDEPYL